MQHRGFTLVEVIIGIAAMAILILGIYQLPGLFAQQEKQIALVVTKDRIFKSFAQKFIQIAERADVALRFQYLPLPVTCGTSGACVRQLEDGKELKTTTVSGAGVGVQFFSDNDAELTESSPFEESPAHSVVKVLSRRALNFDTSVTKGGKYATWPLETAASPAFPLLTRSDHNDYFFMVDEFVTSTSASRWVIVEGIRPGFPVKELEGKAIVAYNTNDFAQFFVQKVKNGLDCTTTDTTRRDACTAAARSVKPSFDPAANPGFFSSNKYALELIEFTETELADYLPALGLTPSSWGAQPSSLYIFPTRAFSLVTHSVAGDPWVQDVKQLPADAKRFAHLQHTLPSSLQGKVALLPVELVRYKLQDVLDSNGKPTGKRVLEMRTLGTGKSIGVLEDLSETSSVVFARRLGSTELEVFQFE